MEINKRLNSSSENKMKKKDKINNSMIEEKKIIKTLLVSEKKPE